MDSADNSGRTVLSWAAIAGYGEIIKVMFETASVLRRIQVVPQVLVDRGAHLDVTDTSGQTALHWASRFGRLDAATVSTIPTCRNSDRMAQILIAAGASKTKRNYNGLTPVQVICVETSSCSEDTRAALLTLLMP